jgi:hypothetical protein
MWEPPSGNLVYVANRDEGGSSLASAESPTTEDIGTTSTPVYNTP